MPICIKKCNFISGLLSSIPKACFILLLFTNYLIESDVSLKQIEVVIRALPVFIFQSEDSLSTYYFAMLFYVG